MQPRDRDRQPDQDDARRRAEHAGDVARGSALSGNVHNVHRAVDDRERSEEQGERRPHRRAPVRERVDGADSQEERKCGGERVLAEADARLAV
jgi:hypothetical protein